LLAKLMRWALEVSGVTGIVLPGRAAAHAGQRTATVTRWVGIRDNVRRIVQAAGQRLSVRSPLAAAGVLGLLRRT
jgi:hypothetical protein